MEKIFEAAFLVAFNRTAAFEKWYANNPHDKGGETWRGISRFYWPSWEGWYLLESYHGNIAKARENEMLEKMVRIFYLHNFWYPMQGDAAAQLSTDIAAELFDTGVLCGINHASEFLQKALNMQNNFGKTYPDLVVDGRLGKKTMGTLQRYLQSSPGSAEDNEGLLLNCLNGEQYCYLKSLRQHERFRGWFKRV